MKFSLVQTASYSRDGELASDFFEKLPRVIRDHTDWEYSGQQRADGWHLNPTFKNMPYRNSFVPEIKIVTVQDGTQTTLQISGQPVKIVRVGMKIWFGFLALMLILFLMIARDSVFYALIPVGMGLFGYLLCKHGTKAAFHKVLQAISKA